MENTSNLFHNNKENNVYNIIRKYLNKQYPNQEKSETISLCREVIFAPETYIVEINNQNTPITKIRENLANYIERDNANKDFIPYSLDAEIADLIEKNNCETSSINEYYRWISATSDIIKNASDKEITDQDRLEQKDFITMSFDREAEILLCLALYQGANIPQNKEKINILRFKLARLREMRSIVNNVISTNNLHIKPQNIKKELQKKYEYCLTLLKEKNDFGQDFNLKLKININHNTNEDLEEDFSYLSYLRQIVLYMMRKLEKSSTESQRSENSEEIVATHTNDTILSAINKTEGRLQ